MDTSIADLIDFLRTEVGGSVSFSYKEQECFFPGGSYTNRLIVVSDDEKTRRYCADLALRSPMVAVTEIRRAFNLGDTKP